MSITKNRKSEAKIYEMIHQIFSDDRIIALSEITEGMFNAVYRIELSERGTHYLKIAPSDQIRTMRSEKDALKREVFALNFLKNYDISVRVPAVKVYDETRQVLDADYFIMDAIPGKSLYQSMEQLNNLQLCNIQSEVGRITRQMNSITNPVFGDLIDSNRQGSDWFRIFYQMMEDMLADAEDIELKLPVCCEELLLSLRTDAYVFQEVHVPCLVHWDLWERNIIIDREKISGIVDFERCFFGDPLMEFGFRTYNQTDEFLHGYGKTDFSKEEQIRNYWYDIYWFLFNMNEGFFRRYEDTELYEWGRSMMISVWQSMKGE